jgi:hypothetical protein
VFLGLAPAVSAAHVGSPDVIYEGKAGPYDVRVIVRVPMVVPGLAEVTVRVLHGEAREVHIRPVFWRTGVRGSPSPDVAKPIAGVTGMFVGQLWLMARGAYSVYVNVDGPSGTGSASIPVMSVATGRLGMTAGLGAVLVALGALLVAALITIVYLAAGESVVAPGAVFDAPSRRRARLVTSIGAPVVALALLGGARWWGNVDHAYQMRLYRPLPTRATVTRDGGTPTLHFEVVDSTDKELALDPLMPDHGKLMHLFIIDGATMTSFAHLHPLYNDTGSFVTTLPPLPPGRYRLFGDITTETGQTRTLTGIVSLTSDDSIRASTRRLDADDAWVVSPGVARRNSAGAIDTLADGSTMEWVADTAAIRPGAEAALRFRLRDPSGAVVTLEPYLGMMAHAVVARIDGSVFAHLHPEGTISMAALSAFALRDRGDTTPSGRLRLASADMPAMPTAGEFSIPYIFPRAGSYRIWVQVRRNGRVLTGVYNLTL